MLNNQGRSDSPNAPNAAPERRRLAAAPPQSRDTEGSKKQNPGREPDAPASTTLRLDEGQVRLDRDVVGELEDQQLRDLHAVVGERRGQLGADLDVVRGEAEALLGLHLLR